MDSLRTIISNTPCDTTRMASMMALAELLYQNNPDSSLYYYSKTRDLCIKTIGTSTNPEIITGARKHLATAFYNLGYVNDDFGETDTAFLYYQKSLTILKILTDHPDKKVAEFGKQGEANVYNDLGYIYKYRGDYKRAMDCYMTCMNINRELKNYKRLATILNNIGSLYRTKGDIQMALRYITASLKIAEIIHDHEETAYSANGLANIYEQMGNIPEAISYYQTSMKSYEIMGSRNGQAYVLNNLAILYSSQGDDAKAMEYYKQANDYFEKTGDKKSMSILYNNIGSLYEKKGQFDQALQQYQLSQRLCEESAYKQGLATALGNIGLLLDKTGDKNQAMEYYRKSAEIGEEIGEKQGLVSALVNMGTLYLAMNNTQKAMQLGQKSFNMSNELGFPFLIKASASLQKQIYQKLGNYKEAMYYYELEIKMRDSIANEENFKQAMKQQARYEYEKKAATDSLEHVKAIEIKNIEIAKVEEEKKKQRIILIAFIAGFILITVFSVTLFRLFVQKKRANKILAEQKRYIELQNKNLLQANEEISAQRDEIEAQRDEIAAQRDLVTGQKEHIEEQKKEITDSITYARRIQKAVLPDLDMVFGNSLTEGTPSFCCDYFVLYKPKDIVSGDFYWATRIGDWCIFTVADCTGHGVPGAFMSMLGISNLNEIVRRKEITKTGEVLDQLRKAVIEALKQKGVTGEQKDGMDIVFCAYNNQTRILQYSGANNSLYILKKDSAGYELNEYKADPQPVAIHVSMTNFTTHEIPVEKGDMLYLISDGYADQFGGPKNKKFMIRNLKSLLCDISSKPLNEQKEILETTIREWMGNNEQIDDITLMGIKI